ncbi:hypothetical protein GCM10011581_19450 [Saccharopolyspora subtropica]|uniref:Excreted virulence factor EspC (Type VII ESX diderm) n=1 Tax=Saccharopolyspora thermophila TaxID=89367 RepID=A0A917NAA9_9PSEU|nr:hypothetical protein [Saccharopolyspora subtropica]GGI82126.1 hypothetical protein GCM10011581_19450 [Saccharopolyspora subtropica]
MTDYSVVPQALRANVKLLFEAADAWDRAYQALSGNELSDDDLGLLGELSAATKNYNAALAEALQRLKKGQEVLEKAANSLKAVADDYESRDAEYYEKFGYLKANM